MIPASGSSESRGRGKRRYGDIRRRGRALARRGVRDRDLSYGLSRHGLTSLCSRGVKWMRMRRGPVDTSAELFCLLKVISLKVTRLEERTGSGRET